MYSTIEYTLNMAPNKLCIVISRSMTRSLDTVAGNQGRPLVETESYDQSTDMWTVEGNLPTAHCSCAYTMLQGRLHIIGGLSTGGPTGAVESLIYKK